MILVTTINRCPILYIKKDAYSVDIYIHIIFKEGKKNLGPIYKEMFRRSAALCQISTIHPFFQEPIIPTAETLQRVSSEESVKSDAEFCQDFSLHLLPTNMCWNGPAWEKLSWLEDLKRLLPTGKGFGWNKTADIC